jgi:hypothetical protein
MPGWRLIMVKQQAGRDESGQLSQERSSQERPNQAITLIFYGVVAGIIALYIFQSLHQPIGSAVETTGVVQGSAFVPADGPPPSKNVWVRLSNGSIVVINTRPDLMLTPGQKVRLLVNHRLLSNTPSYAIAHP